MWRRTVNRKQSRFAPPATSPASDLMSGSDSRAGPAERYQSSTTALTDGRDTSERHLLRRGRVGGPSRNQSVRPLQKVAALVGALTDKQPSSGSADRQAASGITVEDPGADLTESRLKSQTAGWIAMKESGLWASPLLCVVVLGCLSWVHPGQALKKTGQASKKSGQALKKPGSNASGLARQPHLIFIMVDDQGYNDVGYHGSLIQTPVLDRLAAKGVKLENYYVQPICSPSRSQLMTGRYQIHTGLQHSIIRPRQPLCLPPDTPTLAERLREVGYSTHMVGKWHLGFCRPGCLPTGRGFQTFLGSLTGSGDHYTFHNCDRAETCGFDLHDGERPAWEMSGNYSTLLYTQRVKKILRTHDHKRPLFLYLALQAVHTPLQAPTRFLQMYSSLDNRQRRHYAAMVSCVDEAVGEVVQELRDRGLYRNSVLIYSTDNGGQPLSGGSNWPLRGGKGTYWEGGVRAVGFVHSPLLKRKGVVNKALVHISDWYPTLLSLAGASAKSLRHLDGHNVWAAISEGLPSPRTEILFNIDPVSRRPGAANPQTLRAGFGIWDTAIRASIRAGDWKLLTGNVGDGDWVPPQTHAGGPAGWEALEKRRDQPWKSVWLFNITADPYERRDLSKSRPEVVKVLMARLAEYNQTAIPPRNPPDDPFADPQLHGGVWTPWLGQRNRGTQRGKGVGAKGKRRGRMKDCKVCKLRALFRKVGTRLQRAAAFF